MNIYELEYLREWIGPGLIILMAGLLQSSVGFGFSLFLVPLLLTMGHGLVETVTIAIVGSTAQRILAVRHLRKAIDWHTLVPMMITGVVALLLGLYLLYEVSFLKQGLIKRIIGGCILILLMVQWFGKFTPKESIHKSWGHLAAFFCGILSGLANIGGPPLILWMLAHRWHNEKMRVMPMAFSLVFVPFQLVILLAVFRMPAFNAGVKAIVLTPLALLGGWAGLRVGEKFSRQQLRLIVRLLLLTVALTSIISP